MKLRYSPEADALVITLKDEALSYGEEVSDDIIAHYSESDELVEIEVLRTSSFFKKRSEVVVPEEAVI
ncbi:MAG: DUF2283 domain-containing protein [Dehalococcoidia bacterium]|nr:DUF2283 domain-containing protein [Dehalococcoidia bacterium]